MIKSFRYKYPYFPIIGLGLYIVFFLLATTKYPGGSINDITTVGYSYFHNFLCDLMLIITESGIVNTARPLGVISHILLGLTMMCFFYILPEIFRHTNKNTLIVRRFGVLTMCIFILMFTPYHDTIVILTGIFGTIALIPFFIELPKCEDNALKIMSVVCFTLSIIVYLSFVTKVGFYYLPMLQKITFVIDAFWVIWVSLIVAKKHEEIGKVTV